MRKLVMNLRALIRPYPSQIVGLSVITFVALAGFSFIWPLTSLYVTQVLRKSPVMAGEVLSLEAVAGICGSFIGGLLQDKVGGKIIAFVSGTVMSLSALTLALSTNWTFYLIAFSSMNFFIGVLSTVINAMVGIAWPEGGRQAFNVIYVSRNLGVSLGAALAGIAASFSFTFSFMITAICFGGVSLLTMFAVRESRRKADKVVHQGTTAVVKPSLISSRMAALLLLGLGVILNLASYIQWQTTIPIFMATLGIPLKAYSVLWTLNGILIIVLQPLSRWLEKFVSKDHIRLYIGQAFFIGSFSVLLVFPQYSGFVLAMIFTTVAEMVVWPTIPSLVAGMATIGREGLYQGIGNVFNYGGRLLGPIIGTVIYQFNGMSVFLIVMLACYAGAMVAFVLAFYFMNLSNSHRMISVDECVSELQ